MIQDLSIEEIFSSDGLLAKRLSHFEPRSTQTVMARAVMDAIEQQHHLCVEAGTGTGKTLAYLIPALYSKKRVIVSTATKNLQDQLLSKDIPFIQENILPDLSVAYMKGRHNYLCLKRLYDQKSQLLPLGVLSDDYQRMADWASETEMGDRAELDWVEDSDPLWNALDARSETCTGQKCSHFRDCYVTKMRQKAFEADLVVVNHALFFANLALETDEIGRVLPDFSVLILDEAHEVEDTAAAHFGRRLSSYQIEELERDCARLFPEEKDLGDALLSLRRSAAAFFASFPEVEGRHSLNFFRKPDHSLVDLRELLSPGFGMLMRAIQLFTSELQLVGDRPDEWDSVIRRTGELASSLEDLFVSDDSNQVYWFERRGRGTFLNMTPIDVAGILRERLFERTDATILTSATLTTGGTFDYFKSRLGVPDPVELLVPGEFDFRNQAILYVPSSLPPPQSPSYFEGALEEIRRILEISQGHAFLLFTSFRQMNRCYEALAEESPFPFFRQGEMPKNLLLDLFRETPHSVLCATASFWQGVDVRGDALRVVVIDKLPFQVPTEPVVAARTHRMLERGENAFLGYTVPDAIITLKQGLGRLIRSKQDWGILAVLDTRLRTKRYGDMFLRSLPNCPVTDKIESLRNFFRTHASPADRGS